MRQRGVVSLVTSPSSIGDRVVVDSRFNCILYYSYIILVYTSNKYIFITGCAYTYYTSVHIYDAAESRYENTQPHTLAQTFAVYCGVRFNTIYIYCGAFLSCSAAYRDRCKKKLYRTIFLFYIYIYIYNIFPPSPSRRNRCGVRVKNVLLRKNGTDPFTSQVVIQVGIIRNETKRNSLSIIIIIIIIRRTLSGAFIVLISIRRSNTPRVKIFFFLNNRVL